MLFISIFPVVESNAAASDYAAGCWAYAYKETNVYDNAARTSYSGKKIYPSEGITVLQVHNTSAGNVYYINYSTPNGPKFGYVLWK